MEEFEEIDYQAISKSRAQLNKFSVDRYWNEFKGDWKGYMSEVFKYDDEPKSVDKPFRLKVEIKEEVNPFW